MTSKIGQHMYLRLSNTKFDSQRNPYISAHSPINWDVRANLRILMGLVNYFLRLVSAR